MLVLDKSKITERIPFRLMEQKTNRPVTEVTDEAAQALAKILSQRMKEKSKWTKKPTTTILSWDSAAITK